MESEEALSKYLKKQFNKYLKERHELSVEANELSVKLKKLNDRHLKVNRLIKSTYDYIGYLDKE